MALRDTFLRIDSDGSGTIRLKEISTLERKKIASLAGTHFAENEVSGNQSAVGREGYLHRVSAQTGGADSIGHINDTYYQTSAFGDSVVGSSLTNQRKRFAMGTTAAGDSAVELDMTNLSGQKPIIFNSGNTPHRLDAASFQGAGYNTDAVVRSFLDELIVDIFQDDLPGVLCITRDSNTVNFANNDRGPDSDEWKTIYKVDNVDSTAENTNIVGQVGHFIRQKKQFRPSKSTSKISLVDGNKSRLVFADMSGAGGTFNGLKAMSDSDVGRFFGSAIARRIAYNQVNDGVGKLVIAQSSPGVAYRSLGGVNDVKQADGTTVGLATFAGTRPATFSGQRVLYYSGVRPGVLGNPTFFVNPFAGNFTRVLYQNYSGSQSQNFTSPATFGVLGGDFGDDLEVSTELQSLWVKIS